MSDTIELTADEAACLIKIAHGMTPAHPEKTMGRVEGRIRDCVFGYRRTPYTEPYLTPRGRRLLEAYLAKHGEDA